MSKVFVLGVLILSAGIGMARAASDTPAAPDPAIQQVPADVARWFTDTMDKVLEPVAGPNAEPAAAAPPKTEPARGHRKHQ